MDLGLIRDGSAELGFLFRPDRRGNGLACQVVSAVVTQAVEPFGLTRLASVIQAHNRAAARVLERTGFEMASPRSVTITSGEARDCGFYLLRRDQSSTANGR